LIVLVTRPLDQGQTLATRLRERGHEPLLLPLLRIEPVADAVRALEGALDGAQALLFTSANGVRAFAAASPRRELPVFAVGEQTAAVAVEVSFGSVESAGGDVESLAALVADRLAAGAGALVHVAGETVAGDLAGTLEARGFQVRRVTLYRAEAAEEIDAEVASALRAHRIGAALFYSPRTAAIFASLVRAAKLEAALAASTAVALSPAVAATLTPLPWARVVTARQPSEPALLEALDLVAPAEAVRSSPETMSEAEIIPASGSPPSGAPEPEAMPPPAAPTRRPPDDGRRRTTAISGLALVVAVAALAGVAYLVWLAPPPANTSASDQGLRAAETEIAALRSRLDAAEAKGAQVKDLEARLTALEQRASNASTGSGQAAERLRALGEQIAALEQRLNQLPDNAAAIAALQTETKSLEAETQSLAQKLDAQSSALADLATHQQQTTDHSDAALLIALQQLRLALAGAEPFAAPLHTAEALAQDHADLRQQLQDLDAHAESGIPTVAQLTARFETMANRVLEAEPAPSDGGWLADAGSFLMRFFDVRRESGGSETEAALAAAQKALKTGDLAGAIAALKRLQGASAEPARGWIGDAEARTDAERRMAAIDAAVERQWVKTAPPRSTP